MIIAVIEKKIVQTFPGIADNQNICNYCCCKRFFFDTTARYKYLLQY